MKRKRKRKARGNEEESWHSLSLSLYICVSLPLSPFLCFWLPRVAELESEVAQRDARLESPQLELDARHGKRHGRIVCV